MFLNDKYVVRLRKTDRKDGKHYYSVETEKGLMVFSHWPTAEIAQVQADWYNGHRFRAFYYTRIRPWTIGKYRRCVLAFE